MAAILRPGDPEPEVLLIRRAEKVGDPWSGHMAFPGGRADPRDPDLRATAVRETREEVGLDLENDAELIGILDDIPAMHTSAVGIYAGEEPGFCAISYEYVVYGHLIISLILTYLPDLAG